MYQPPSPLEGIMRGLQIRQMVEDIKARREARAQQAELHQLQIEEHRRKRSADEFNMNMTLQQMGAIPSTLDTQRAEQGLTDVFGPTTSASTRSVVQVPVGNTTQPYYMPSQADQEQQATRLGRQKGLFTAAQQQAEEGGLAEVPVPEELQPYAGQTAKIPKSKLLDYAIKIAGAVQKQNPALKVTASGPNDAGDITIWSHNPDTNEIKIEKVLPGVGKSAKTTASGLTPHQQFTEAHTLRQEDVAQQKEATAALLKAQDAINTARMKDAIPNTTPEDPNTGPAWQNARIAAQQAAMAHPDRIEAGIDPNGYPYVKPKTPTARPAAAPSGNVPALTKAAKVGGVYMHKGEKVKVVSIDPNGNLQLERVP